MDAQGACGRGCGDGAALCLHPWTEVNRQFAEAFRQGRAPALVIRVHCYDATSALTEAVNSGAQPNRESLGAELQKTSFDGPRARPRSTLPPTTSSTDLCCKMVACEAVRRLKGAGGTARRGRTGHGCQMALMTDPVPPEANASRQGFPLGEDTPCSRSRLPGAAEAERA